MQKLISITLIGIILVSQSAASLLSDTIIEEYQRIGAWLEIYLGKNINTEVYLEVAAHYHEANVAGQRSFGEYLAWERFTSLHWLLQRPFECRLNETELLQKNVDLSSLDRTAECTNCFNLVQNIVNDVAMRHAKFCEPVYVQRLEAGSIWVPTDILKPMGSIEGLPSWVSARFREVRPEAFRINYPLAEHPENDGTYRPNTPKDRTFRAKLERGEGVADIVASAIKLDPEVQANGINRFRQYEFFGKNFFREIQRLLKSLHQKCWRYWRSNWDVLEPAMFDAGTYNGNVIYGSQKLSKTMFRYYMCKLLTVSKLPMFTTFDSGVRKQVDITKQVADILSRTMRY